VPTALWLTARTPTPPPDPEPTPASADAVGTPPAPATAGSAREPSLWYLAAAGALYAGLLIGLVGLTEPALLDRAETEPWTFLWIQVLDDGILTGVALLFGRLRYPGSWTALGFRRVGPRWWLAGLVGGLVAAALAWAVSAGFETWGAPVPRHPVESVLAEARTVPDRILVLLAVTVPVAIGEEVFFRGYAYRLLRARLGPATGLVTSALLFALVHGIEPGAWVPVLPVGLVLAVLLERSGSLLPAMLAHAVVNSLAVLTG
jgi:membrane protease YdiL (CAAX protease family)